jgi:hypothetical protein
MAIKNRVIAPTLKPMDSSLVTIYVVYGVSKQSSPTLEGYAHSKREKGIE